MDEKNLAVKPKDAIYVFDAEHGEIAIKQVLHTGEEQIVYIDLADIDAVFAAANRAKTMLLAREGWE